MKTSAFLPLLCVVALGAWQAASMLVCSNTTFCHTVQCVAVDPASCPGQIRPNATVCGCCEGCIDIINTGDYCPYPNQRPGTETDWECAPGSQCIDYQCTEVETTTEVTEPF